MRIGLLQYSPVWEDAPASRERIRTLLDGAPPVDLLALPEMGFTGFSMDPSRTELSAADHDFMSRLACERGCAVVYGGSQDGRNVLVLRDREGQLLSTYAKRHLFALGGEAKVYQAGSERPVPVWVEGLRLLPSICYDLRFPVQFWNQAGETDLILLAASWPAAREAHWRTLLTARAIENQCWVAAVNRVGADPRVQHAGASLVIDPGGKVVLDAGSEEGLFVAEIDAEAVRRQRAKFPFLGDRLD